MPKLTPTLAISIVVALVPAVEAVAQQQELEIPRNVQSVVTEIWEPVPEKVDAPEGELPSDAIVLFDGTNLDAWESVDGGPAEWTIADDMLSVARGTGDIRTTESFCDIQLHIEWRVSENIEGYDGQDRGNSGIKIQDRYEVQILDSIDNPTYANGQAASIYKQHPPLVNASRAPGEWQTYDIVFEAPIFAEDGALRRPAYVTVLHNGVVVQNHAQIQGTTAWVGYPRYEAHDCQPIRLQDHNADVDFRNIWVRPL